MWSFPQVAATNIIDRQKSTSNSSPVRSITGRQTTGEDNKKQLASFRWPEVALIHTIDGQFPLRLVILGVRKERALFPTVRPSEIKIC